MGLCVGFEGRDPIRVHVLNNWIFGIWVGMSLVKFWGPKRKPLNDSYIFGFFCNRVSGLELWMPGRVFRAFACFFRRRTCTCMRKPASGFRGNIGVIFRSIPPIVMAP